MKRCPATMMQLEYANDVEPRSRRLLRAVLRQWTICRRLGAIRHPGDARRRLPRQLARSCGLTFQEAGASRVLANAILDIRLQTNRVGDQEALDLMEKQTFQEKEEATGKLQRAKLSSAQLPMYLLGWRGWIRVREQAPPAGEGGGVSRLARVP